MASGEIHEARAVLAPARRVLAGQRICVIASVALSIA